MLVESNVLLDVLTEDPVWYAWSSEKLLEVLVGGEAAINPLIYAEVSVGFEKPGELEAALAPLRLNRLPLPWEAAFHAGKAFLMYRKRGGEKQSPLPDFYIGAHAQTAGLEILTRDPKRYRTYFPSVELICPA